MSEANTTPIDVTVPGKPILRGHLHPLSLVMRDIGEIFSSMGFEIAQGPELETEYYNFDALNIPKDHPARDMWDTFWLNPQTDAEPTRTGAENEVRRLLRTHTSPMQVRYMEEHQPPLRIIVPGRCYRYEATDATHEAQFYQFEGLMIGKEVSLANMKYILQQFFTRLFATETVVRMRPSFFPFVEPGVEVDCSCFKCKGKGLIPAGAGTADHAWRDLGCSMCKGTGWIEIMGAGMVHPKVLEGVNIDPREWRGFAFGAGIDRIAMLKYGIDDIRLFYNGDLRFVDQF